MSEVEPAQPKAPPPQGCLVALAIPAVVFLLLALTLTASRLAFRARAVSAEGTVVEYAVSSSRSTGGKAGRRRTMDSTAYLPVVEYRDAGGRVHRVKSAVGSSRQTRVIGETMSVLYEPEHPEDARIDDPMELWVWPGLFGLCSLPFVYLVLRGVYATRRARARQPGAE